MPRFNPHILSTTWIALILTTVASAAQDTDPPPMNTLRGIVVSKTNGQPLPGVPVAMAHAEEGYLTIQSGTIAGSGAPRTPRNAFSARNDKVFCDAISGPDGSFTLRNFCAPSERWTLAAGDAQHGVTLRESVIPAEHAQAPLRIELDSPAFITIRKLPDPADATARASVEIEILDLDLPASRAGAGTDARMMPPVTIYAWPDDREAAEWRLGPLPPGRACRIAHRTWNPTLRYDVTLFERRITPKAGVTERISLDPDGPLTLAGRITDTRGRPLPDVNVLLRVEGDAGIAIGTLSDADGRYSLSKLPAGAHTLELLRHARPSAPTCGPLPRDVKWTQPLTLAAEPASTTRDIENVIVCGVYAGQRAPDFEATTLDGRSFKLSELRGKLVLLDFWATWCGPCVAEIPSLVAVRQENPTADFEVVSISIDPDADVVRRFVAEKKMAWTQIWAERGSRGPLAELYGVSAVPATFLIGPDGKVIDRELRGAALRTAVKKNLAASARPEPADNPR